ncbi:MAG: hypothetical protein AB1762_16210 [Gemmatimonadota bacterium]
MIRHLAQSFDVVLQDPTPGASPVADPRPAVLIPESACAAPFPDNRSAAAGQTLYRP